jgi:hypothetical protein
MNLSRTTLALAMALLIVPVVLTAAIAEAASRKQRLSPTKTASSPSDQAAVGADVPQQESAPAQSGSSTSRQLNRSGMMKAARRPDDATKPWQPGPIPETIKVDVSGVSKDESGNAIAGAIITLYAITEKGSQAAATATTDSQGIR